MHIIATIVQNYFPFKSVDDGNFAYYIRRILSDLTII